jgi:hypothetical protein
MSFLLIADSKVSFSGKRLSGVGLARHSRSKSYSHDGGVSSTEGDICIRFGKRLRK